MRQIFKTITVVFFFLLLIASCNKEELLPTIRLITPETDASINLNEEKVRFEWQVTGIITSGYTLTLANDLEMTTSKTYETTAATFSKEVHVEEMDLLLKEWGFQANELATIYWRVSATGAEASVDAEPLRPVNIRRLVADAIEIELKTPASNQLIDLEVTPEVTFEWDEYETINGYILEFSQSQDGDKLDVNLGVDLAMISDNSITISSERLNSMITSLGLTSPVVAFWWKVRSTIANAPGVSESRKVRFIQKGAGSISPVTNAEVFPGNKRVKLTWNIDDPRISEVSITWNGGSEDVVVEPDTEYMEVFIEGLSEGSHVFKLLAKDMSGNVADEVQLNANVYGDAFSEGKENRSLEVASLTRDGILLSIPKIESDYLLKSELTYTNAQGDIVIIDITNDAIEHLFDMNQIRLGEDITLQSFYAPEPDAIDIVEPSPASSVFVPVYQLMDKTKHAKVPDIITDHGALDGFGYELLFDGITTGSLNMWHTSGASTNASGSTNSLVDSPILLTLDLGETANLSSFVIWGRDGGTPDKPASDASGGSFWAYGSYNARKFEVWGSNKAPANIGDESIWKADGAWKISGDWVMLADCEIKRPSGNMGTSYRNEDLEKYPGAYPPNEEDLLAAARGFEFSVPMDKPAVRYVRLVITKNWDTSQRKRVSQAELSFYKYTPDE